MTTSTLSRSVTSASAASAALVDGASPDTNSLHHVDPAVAGPVRQRAAQRGGDHLLRGPLRVAARLRAVHDAAAGELRRAGRALTGAAGALLPVRLAPPPRTSPRLLVEWVPWRAAASWATTTWWISGMLT